MLTADEIHKELKRLGCDIRPGEAHPFYAYEHYVGEDTYLYVKRKVKKEPLVLPPLAGEIGRLLRNISGLHVASQPSKNSNYRRFPKRNGQSQFGYPAEVANAGVLNDVVNILRSSPTDFATPTQDDLQPHK
jgi:5-methylcytosine-specific restriction protein B